MSYELPLKNMMKLWSKYGSHTGRFISTFMDNRRVFQKGGRPKRGPLVLIFNASPVCNARCSFCKYWKKSGEDYLRASTSEERAKIVKQAGAAGVWLLSFCAAEPLLMDDIEDLIALAKRAGMLVNISTNGSRLKEKARMLCDLGVDMVTISIDSHIASEHDDLRGYPGLYSKIEEGVEQLREIRSKGKPWICVRHLLSGKNAFNVAEMVNAWRSRCDEMLFKVISSTNDGTYTVPPEFAFDPERISDFREYFFQVLKKYPELDNEYHRNIPDHIAGTLPQDRYFCMAGSFFGDIDQKGDLYACIEQGESMGTVLDGGMMELWASEKMNSFRKNLKENRRCQACWADRFRQGVIVQKVLNVLGGVG